MNISATTSILKDVVAYLDVWSSDKRANYSGSFIKQLHEMGAQVSKRFNKQVTHVVFNNGHQATWRKAEKSDVHLVSALWVKRCYDDGTHVDEGLFPALNDESNPVMKNRKHRCMLPKQSPERNTENDWRLKKKFDKMMKNLAPKEPMVTDVSPVIIDAENGIIYSPSLKRSDYMAERLKDMKDKRQDISPTASQVVESASPTRQIPDLGNTPTINKFTLDDQSDDDFCPPLSALRFSPDKKEHTSDLEVKNCNYSMGSGSSPCQDSTAQIFPAVALPHLEQDLNKRENDSSKSRSTQAPVKEMGSVTVTYKDKSNSEDVGENQKFPLLKVTCQSPLSSDIEYKKRSRKDSSNLPSQYRPEVDVLSKSLTTPSLTLDFPAKVSNGLSLKLNRGEQKSPRSSKLTVLTLNRSLNKPKLPPSVSSKRNNDEIFEDYFSPANKKSFVFSNKPKADDNPLPFEFHSPPISLPFELNSEPTKRKKQRGSCASESQKEKRQRLMENCRSKSNQESQSLIASLTAQEIHSTGKQRKSTSKDQQDLKNCTAASSVEQLSVPGKVLPVEEMLKKSDSMVLSPSLNSGGNDDTGAAGFEAHLTEPEENDNKQDSLSAHKMVSKTKIMRTLVMTSMPTEKQNTVVQVVKTLGGFSIVDQVCESTTHVVSGGQRRTLNIMLGIARGCWILSFEWILWCLEQRQWIPEEPYELSEQFPAAQICRLQKHLSAGEHQQDLFQYQPAMFVSQQSQPPTQSLLELIQLCGGTICKTVRQAGICIGKYSGRRPEGCRILSEQWILDSITNLKTLPYDNYDLE